MAEQAIKLDHAYSIKEAACILHIPLSTFRLEVFPVVDRFTYLSGGAVVVIQGGELIKALEKLEQTWAQVEANDRRRSRSSKNPAATASSCDGKKAAAGEKNLPKSKREEKQSGQLET